MEMEVSFKECTEKRKDIKEMVSVNADDRTAIDDNIGQILSCYISAGIVKTTPDTGLILHLNKFSVGEIQRLRKY